MNFLRNNHSTIHHSHKKRKDWSLRYLWLWIHALISLVDFKKKYLDNDYFVCGIFIHLQKTFDTVNHDIVLAKLDHYDIRGIRGLANSCLSSFLKTRTQYVYLDGHCSITKQVPCGVRQGSTLGPLLFPCVH